jgi:hypothetical protein
MLDSMRQVEVGDIQHNERGRQATIGNKQVMDNVRQSGSRATQGNPAVGDTTVGRGREDMQQGCLGCLNIY